MTADAHGDECLLCCASFVQDLISDIIAQEPDATSGLSQEVVRTRVQVAVERAVQRGARSEAAIRRFALLMFALEPEFDERYRVRQYFSSCSGSFDDCILRMHEWSHPNCWYRSERRYCEDRWSHLTSRDEPHVTPIVALPGIRSDAGRPAQLSSEYGFQLDVPYFETPEDVVLSMLRLARVGPADTVVDLGCGDGNILITAAAVFQAQGIGIDINPERIETARTNARQAGVSQRLTFRCADLFDTDLSVATVVTLYLLRDINLALRRKLQDELPNGARIVSWRFDMADWQPNVQAREGSGEIYCWHVNRPGAPPSRPHPARPEISPMLRS